MNLIKKQYNKNKVNYLVSQYVKSNKGETQDSVAAKMGISKSTLYGGNPTVDTLIKICDFLGIEFDDLFTPSKAEKPSKQNHTNIVATPVAVYAPPEGKDELKLREQQIKITGLLEEKIEWMEKAHSLELELERVKNATAPAKDALAG